MVEGGIVRLAPGGGATHRRQGPDAERVVLAILGIGVDLAGLVEHEAGLLAHLQGVGLLHIAVGGQQVGDAAGDRPVLLQPQHAPGLQGREGVVEGFLRQARRHPVVQVAQEQHQVGGTGRGHRPAAGAEGGDLHRAIEFGLVGQLAAEGGDHLAGGRVAGVVLQAGLVELAPGGREEGGQDLGVPAGPGPELHHRPAGLQAPEVQGLGGVAEGVAGLVGGGAPVAVHGLLQAQRPAPGRGGLAAAGGQSRRETRGADDDAASREPQAARQVGHGQSRYAPRLLPDRLSRDDGQNPAGF